MATHPVFLRLTGRRCVVIGADAAATAKAVACAAAGGDVVVIAPTPVPSRDGIRQLCREYRPGDLAGAFVAYASTRDPELIQDLVADAERARVLLNVIDVPDACTFIAPAVLERGELQVAIGTGGASPGLAARLRRDLETEIGAEYGPFVAILGAVRRTLAAEPVRAGERGRVVNALVDSPLLAFVRDGDRAAIDALLARLVGPDITLERLGVDLAAGA